MPTGDPKLTRAAITLFEKKAEPTNFFSSMFAETEPTNQTLIPIDIVREEEDIAIDVVPGSGAANFRKNEPLTNKEYMPPEYDEAYFMAADEVAKRLAGRNAYEPTDRMAIAAAHIARSLRKSRNRILRSIELQAVEILTKGTITLKGGDSLDYKMKASHKIAASGAWSNPATNVLADIEGAGDVIRQDGLMEPDMLIMGADAMRQFLANTAIKEQVNFRRAEIIKITPPTGLTESGGKFHGEVSVGPYTYSLWTYPQFFKDENGVKQRYLEVDNVIVKSSKGEMVKKWGAINRFADANSEGAQLAGMGSPIATSEAVRFAPYVFLAKRGKGLEVGVRSRPLLIPNDIDSFAVIDTTP